MCCVLCGTRASQLFSRQARASIQQLCRATPETDDGVLLKTILGLMFRFDGTCQTALLAAKSCYVLLGDNVCLDRGRTHGPHWICFYSPDGRGRGGLQSAGFATPVAQDGR